MWWFWWFISKGPLSPRLQLALVCKQIFTSVTNFSFSPYFEFVCQSHHQSHHPHQIWAPTWACATCKFTFGTFLSSDASGWRNLISTPLERQTQSFFSCSHPHFILPYAREWAVNISTLWWLQVFCSQATGRAARGETWQPPASDLSVTSLFFISAERRHLLFQYFINNDFLSKQQCNQGEGGYMLGWSMHGLMRQCELMGLTSCSGISWISESLCSTPFSALGWAKEFTVQLLPLVPTVVASCLNVSKHSSGCVATLRCVIRCLPDIPPGPAV